MTTAISNYVTATTRSAGRKERPPNHVKSILAPSQAEQSGQRLGTIANEAVFAEPFSWTSRQPAANGGGGRPPKLFICTIGVVGDGRELRWAWPRFPEPQSTAPCTLLGVKMPLGPGMRRTATPHRPTSPAWPSHRQGVFEECGPAKPSPAPQVYTHMLSHPTLPSPPAVAVVCYAKPRGVEHRRRSRMTSIAKDENHALAKGPRLPRRPQSGRRSCKIGCCSIHKVPPSTHGRSARSLTAQLLEINHLSPHPPLSPQSGNRYSHCIPLT